MLENEHNPMLAGAKEALKEKLLRVVFQQALEELGDSDAIALEAFKMFGPATELITGAGEGLKERILREVVIQALHQLPDHDTVARDARGLMGEQNPVVIGAGSVLREMVLREVVEASLASMEDVGVVARQARQRIDEGHPAMQAGVEALRNLLLEEIARQSAITLEDARAAAGQAFEKVGPDREEITAAARLLSERLLEEVAGQALTQLSAPEGAAASAHTKVDKGHPSLEAATRALHELLLKDVADEAMGSLNDARATARIARELVDEDETPLVDAVEALKARLMEEVAERTVGMLTDREAVAREARSHVPEKNTVLLEASQTLRDQLFQEIAAASIRMLEDAGDTARRARSHIDETDPALVKSKEVLRSLLIQDIIRYAEGALHNAEAAAREAMSHVDEQDEVIVHARKVLKERMLQSMLTETLREINEAVGKCSEERPEDVSRGTVALETREEAGHRAVPVAAEVMHEAPDTVVDELDSEAAFSLDFAMEHGSGARRPGVTMGLPASEIAPADPPDETAHPEDAHPATRVGGWIRLSDFETADQGSDQERAGISTSFEYEIKAPPEAADEEDSGESGETREPNAGGDGMAPGAFADTAFPTEAKQEGLVFYLYGVMAATGEIDANLPRSGMDPAHPVSTLRHRSMQVLVSKVPAKIYGPDALPSRMKDSRWVEKKVRAHAQIIKALGASRTIVPFRFGTVRVQEDDVYEIIEARYEKLLNTLGRLEGKQEWSLRMYRDRDQLLDHLRASEQIVEDSLDDISRGMALFVKDEMGNVHHLAEKELVQLICENCFHRTHEMLLNYAEQAVQKEQPGHHVPHRKMISNVAYLLTAEKVDAFKAIVEGFAGEYRSLGFSFELTGPWPPFHFVGDNDERPDDTSSSGR